MKKPILLVGIAAILLCLIFSGCNMLGPNTVVYVTLKAEAKTNSDTIIEQPVTFRFEKTGGETFTKDEIFIVALFDSNWNFTTNYAQSGYNLHSGETITVTRIHPLAVPNQETITYTYDSCLSLAKAENPGNENEETLYLTLTPTFLLYDS